MRRRPEQVRSYFDSVADEVESWRAKSAFYHSEVTNLVAGSVPPNRRVLDVGAAAGHVLATTLPSEGVGINVSARLTELGRQTYPWLRFETFDADAIVLSDGFRPEYVISVNLLDHAHDVLELFASLRDVVTERTLVVVTTSNPLWSPLLSLASRIGRRIPDSPRNYITNRDLANIATVQGFDVVEASFALPLPARVPILSRLFNALLPEVPLLRYLSSTQYLAVRPRIPREQLSVSVIVPCHNEDGNVAECVRRMPTMGAGTELIFVDDGSTDATRKAVLAAMEHDERVRLLAYDTNHGKANAVRAGFAAARNDVLMILDADMTVPPEDLPKFLAPLESGVAELVNGTRLIYPMDGEAMPTINYVGNKAFCLLVSWVARQRVSDTLCGTKALLRRDYQEMPLSGRDRWGDFDLLFGAARLKLRILEIPVHYRDRVAGQSKMNVRRDGLLFLRACLAGWKMLRRPETVAWSSRPALAEGLAEISPTAAR